MAILKSKCYCSRLYFMCILILITFVNNSKHAVEKDKIRHFILSIQELKGFSINDLSSYTQFDQNLINGYRYSFILEYDLNGDNKKEFFISLKDKGRSALLILQPNFLDYQIIYFDEEEFCIGRSVNKKKPSIEVVFILESANNGEVYFENDEYRFIMFEENYPMNY